MHGPAMTLRRTALEKIGRLSASTTKTRKAPGLSRLCAQYDRSQRSNGTTNGDHEIKPAAKAPMNIRELEVLLSLCNAAPSVQSLEYAEKLIEQLGPYLLEIHEQNFRPSPYLRSFDPSPWELVARHVSIALLQISTTHASLRDSALSYIKKAVNLWVDVGQNLVSTKRRNSELQDLSKPEEDQDGEVVRFCLVLLGLLSALTEQAEALKASERFVMIQELHSILSEDFLIELEGRLSALRSSSHHYKDNRPWKRVLTTYASSGRPLGAIILQHSFMRLLASNTSLFVTPAAHSDRNAALKYLVDADMPLETFPGDTADGTVDRLAGYVVETISLLEDDVDFLHVSSVWQQHLALSLKAYAFKSFLYLSLFEDAADADVLMGWLEAVVNDPVQLADDELAQVTLECMTVLAKTSKTFSSSLGRSLPRLIVQSKMTPETAAVAADCLARVLMLLPQDMQISTLYSMGNILSVGTDPTRANPNLYFDGNTGSKNGAQQQYYSQQSQGSSISLVTSDMDEMATVHGTVVQAIVRIATRCADTKIISLAMSMLAQKVGRVSSAIDVKIIQGTASLGVRGTLTDLRTALRLYVRVCYEALRVRSNPILQAVMSARLTLARGILKSTPHYEVCLSHLLDIIVSTTGAVQSDKKSIKGGVLGSEEIGQVLHPLAVLVSSDTTHEPKYEDTALISNLTRDAWFNLVAHDFSLYSSLTKRHAADLETLALFSASLVDANRADARESGVELNTVLRRNNSPGHAAQQKAALSSSFPSQEHHIKDLEYAELAFVSAAHLIAGLRARAGSCTRTLEYFYDSKFRSGPVSDILQAIALFEVQTYLEKTTSRISEKFTSPHLALELVVFLQGCCHRIKKVRDVAITSADRIIQQAPSVLCQKSALFAMLELLTLMWMSCLDEESEEVEWQSEYTSKKGNVKIQLSDDFEQRRQILIVFQKTCRAWVSNVIHAMPLYMKGLLQTYLSDFEDQGAYGHVALGRSFAMDMGCIIPRLDNRIGNLDKKLDIGINAASDFLAQYTTRQEYRTIDHIFDADEDAILLRSRPSVITHDDLAQEVYDSLTVLRQLHERLENGEDISVEELRPALRRAAALLCRADVDSRELVRLLVRVPGDMFTSASVKLGISLWTGVLKENSRLESQILVEILMSWEDNFRKKKTVYGAPLPYPDPFFLKQEFAPSDKDAIKRREHYVNGVVAPTMAMIQVMGSQFYATRFAQPSIEKVHVRNIQNVLAAIHKPSSQPLTRELHFRLISAGARTLLSAPFLDVEHQWIFMDEMLSAGMTWFQTAPKWSYGGNKVQIKADITILSGASAALGNLTSLAARKNGPCAALAPRVNLLLALMQSEIYRLSVWLAPVEGGTSHTLHHHHSNQPSEAAISALIPVAWAESPSLAVQLAVRFHSDRVMRDVRNLIRQQPDKVLDEADAVPLLLGVAGSSPTVDQQHIQQLARGAMPSPGDKYLQSLLFWAPVNPITAVTYFLPIFGNHPFVIQYAVRALEWHSVDNTFFYVPQIVQTLRYDDLGYVERYIIEAAKFSQLFAHQIIWNMKANMFKDEDSQIADSIKPTLDKVMEALISSFSDEDRDFYEREFSFFSEVTDISGKLKPYIKRPKPEKKQKIEEELRKIQVDVGVYLPSNPDGVVIGIDRQSGKPLQSHAKAPYMATFRIRKERKDDMEELKTAKRMQAGHAHSSSVHSARLEAIKAMQYEVWQSAIFKVGDDCRQDVLALQLISTFRSIFNTVGLDVYVFPYRVTATAPGCGVIDVLPNSISRDMLGREQVNGLYEYFISHFGGEDSLAFQKARANFVKSMAAYSVISYLLQFKDRHNGNIMIDDQGHILHIDFGFLFSIAPGGVKFERAPFKLTTEMVAVMGGSPNSAPYLRFEELCVKAFLASRPHADKLASLVTPMLESGLPCFKPQTVQHFRERFVLERPEREAAEFMRMLVKRSEGSYSTKGYDQFQLLTNGIPY